MKRSPWRLALGLLALAAALLVARVWEREESGRARDDASPVSSAARMGPCRVRHVVDGDTLDVHCGGQRERVRLLRVDTPEREEPGYVEARRALAGLVADREVYLEFEEPGRPERGDHGRLLAYVHTDDTHANVEMVRAGWSRFWTRYGRGRHAREFVRAERDARSARRGMWGAPGERAVR